MRKDLIGVQTLVHKLKEINFNKNSKIENIVINVDKYGLDYNITIFFDNHKSEKIIIYNIVSDTLYVCRELYNKLLKSDIVNICKNILSIYSLKISNNTLVEPRR